MEQEQVKIKKQVKSINIIILVVIGLILLIGGFFAGMEYKKYQIKHVLENGISEINNIANSELSIENNDKINADNIEDKKEEDEISIKLTKKDFYDGEWDYQDRFIFGFEYTNNTEKDIRAFIGSVIFNDLFGKPLQSISLEYTKELKAGETVYDEDMWEYNPYMNSNVRLKDIPLEDATYSVEIDDIVYVE